MGFVYSFAKTYSKYLDEAGLCCRDEWIHCGGWGEESGYRQMREILALSRRPTAIVVEEDCQAIGAIRAIGEAGLSVPEDISVVAISNILPPELQSVSLTVVDSHVEKIGQLAVEMLRDMLEIHQLPREVTVEPELVAGATTRAICCGRQLTA